MLKKYFVLLFIFIISISFFSFIKKAEALDIGKFGGWAWSDNIGWIDMGGEYGGPGVKFDYQNLTGTSIKNISGYAWSENVGWVSFSETSGCPIAPCQPKIKMKDGQITGWARVLSMKTGSTINNDQEYNPNNLTSSQEWADGWISLSGATTGSNSSAYGTNCYVMNDPILNTSSGPLGTCTGSAWGSEVVGWVDFSKVLVWSQDENKPTLILTVTDPDGGAQTVGPISVKRNTSINFSWSGTNIPTTTDGCTLKIAKGGASMSQPLLPSPSGDFKTTTISINGTYKNTITCLVGSSGGGTSGGNLGSGASVENTNNNNNSNTITSNEVIIYVSDNPVNVSLTSPYCNELDFDTNLPHGISCSGSATNQLGITAVPNKLPLIKEGVASGTYDISCGDATSGYDSSTAIVYNYVEGSTSCIKNPHTKIPTYREN